MKEIIEKTAYGRAGGVSDMRLAAVGPGTPMGELLRRYWQPIGLSGDATSTPRKVRILAEDLILFRDGRGRPGLLHSRCVHRGTTLYYGKVEESGIRCCYHGWMFDVQGHCLDQPCEPDNGAQHRAKVRQPWYPLREEYGMLFAFMGPPEKVPAFLHFPFFDNLSEDECIAADGTSIGTGGGAIVPCNWTHAFENVTDPFHVPILHGLISGLQFTGVLSGTPECTFETSSRGVIVRQERTMPDGRIYTRVTEAMVPNVRLVPHPRPDSFEAVQKVGWILPIDDTSHRIYSLVRIRKGLDPAWEMRQTFNGKEWHELTEAEHRDMPGDFEAQAGQGAITLHSEEHLATTDRGIVMLRRMLKQQMDLVERGGDPANVVLGAERATVETVAGNFVN